MLYIFTATYYEADAWISHYRLKKDTAVLRFQVFYSEEASIRLTVTGCGMISAAAAVSSVCTAFAPGKQDFLLNVGICAGILDGKDCMGELFLCHKITETATGRTFYPDMLYRHGLKEAGLLTGAKPFRSGMPAGAGDFLYDMEASAVYQAGSYFFAPHKMAFLKIVSDNGDAGAVTPKRVKELCALHMGDFTDFAGRLLAIGRTEGDTGVFWDEEEAQKLCGDMRCSVSMALAVKQHIRYCELAGVDYRAAVRDLYREGKLPCRTKKEGKRCFEEFQARLL